jgi:hypothetical protein
MFRPDVLLACLALVWIGTLVASRREDDEERVDKRVDR